MSETRSEMGRYVHDPRKSWRWKAFTITDLDALYLVLVTSHERQDGNAAQQMLDEVSAEIKARDFPFPYVGVA